MMKEKMKTEYNLAEEYNLDTEAGDRITRVINAYPMSLSDCASILEAVAPLTHVMPADDIIRYLQSISTVSNAKLI